MQQQANNEVPSHRACAHCRSQKVRCLPDETNPDVCQRCVRSGRPCVFTPLQKRKQRKRTDTRVAELEREMRAMRALLKERGDGDSPENTSGTGVENETIREDVEEKGERNNASLGRGPVPKLHDGSQLWPAGQNVVQRYRQQPASHEPSSIANTAVVNGRKGDVVDRGVISMEVARRLVSHYQTNLYPQYPQVYIPCSADELRKSRPTLFLAVLAAGAETESASLANALDREVLQEYANRSVVQSEKSVELVQALLVSAVWYIPPNKFGQLGKTEASNVQGVVFGADYFTKYYEYIHMAATMAADIGITTRPSKLNRSRFAARNGVPSPPMHPSEDYANPDLSMSIRAVEESEGTGNIECRRSFLACYAICVGVSISLRRPAMMRVTSYTRECLDYLETSPHAAPGDHLFVAWIRLWMIGEEIGGALSYDDPGDTASLLDTTTQLMVTAFEKRLTEWKTRYAVTEFSPCLQVMYYTLRLFLHELVLHLDHSPEDFKAPYRMGVIHPVDSKDIPIKPVVEAIADLVSSSHALIDGFVGMGNEVALYQPIFAYVRVSFAAFVIAKLCLSASSQHSRLANVIDRSLLKAEAYVDKLILFVQSVIGPNGRHVPSLFLALLFKLRQWCSHPELIQQAENEGAPGDIWPEGLKKAQEDITADGPRISEAMNSSNEPSPDTINSSTGSGGTPVAAWNTPAAWNGESQATFQHVLYQSAAKQQPTASGASEDQAINIPNTPQSVDSHNIPGHEQIFSQPIRADASKTGSNDTAVPPADTAAAAEFADWSAMDQMDLDNSMFSFLNNMDDLTHGGITGFGDWDTLQTDFGSLQQASTGASQQQHS